jgi:protein-disulfide isomerase
MRHLTNLALAGAVVTITACSSSAQQPRPMAPNEVVATVGSASITLGEVDEQAMQASASNFGNVRLVQALYLARREALDEIVANRLFDEEARTRGIDRAALIEQEIAGKAATPTEADIQFWYQAHPERVQGATLQQVHDPIKRMLIDERMTAARTTFLDGLKAKTPVSTRLEPPREKVASAGRPARGPKDAPVEIVEFSDFQCPFCQRANPTVEQILKTYGDKIRFVYRHYPLGNHPDARPAAEAADCAHQQGRFWEFHDALFASPSRLGADDLKAHAVTAGLDAAKFAACVDGRQTKGVVDQDVKEADAVGVSGTPAFFINGRPLEGAQPFAAFKRIIDEELAAKK